MGGWVLIEIIYKLHIYTYIFNNLKWLEKKPAIFLLPVEIFLTRKLKTNIKIKERILCIQE